MNIQEEIICEYLSKIEFGDFEVNDLISSCESAILSQDNPDLSLIDMSLMKNWSVGEIYSYLLNQVSTMKIEDIYVISVRCKVLAGILTRKMDIGDYNGIRNISFGFMMNFRELLNGGIIGSIYTIDHYIDHGCLVNGDVTVDEVKSEIANLIKFLIYLPVPNSAQQVDAPETTSPSQ